MRTSRRLRLLVGITLIFPSPAALAARAPQAVHAPATPDALDTVVLRVGGLDEPTLRAALTRRRPDLSLRTADESTDVARTAFVEVVAAASTLTLDLVLADGRAWHRTLAPGDAPGERAAARLLVQLLAAIAEQRAEPERRDVPLPAWTHPPDAPLELPEPAPTIPPPPEQPQPVTAPAIAPPTIVEDPPPPRTDPPPPQKPAHELGLAADFTTQLGLSPPRDVSPLRGLGGNLRLDVKFPRGLVLGLAARGLARTQDGFQLTRLRGAASVGYVLRRHNFEAQLSAGLSFETWRVQHDGAPVYYAEPGADTRPLLIGGLVRAAPGLRLTPGRRVALRLGAWLELATSVLPTGAAARLSRSPHAGTPVPVFAVGGVELAMGLELVAWIALRRR